MAKTKRTIVGSPLTPTMLEELGAIGELPLRSDDFDPDGNWVNTYRVWICHGYRESGNEEVGHLRIERTSGKSGKSFTLKVDQQIVNYEGALHSVHAGIRCLNNRLASPVRWGLTSSFIGPDGKRRRELGTEEKVQIKADAIEVETDRRTFKRKGSTQLTSDWCLFDAVQRLAFEQDSSLTFDVLEGLSLLRQGHHLSYRGLYPININGKDLSLHWFSQLGHGLLPYDYWLDEHHRLLMAITLSRAYILDDKAPARTKLIAETQRRLFQQRQETNKGGKSK